MTDPIQTAASVRPPPHRMAMDTRDPMLVSSPAARDGNTAQRNREDATAAGEKFKDYLDQTSITVVEKARRKSHADTADLITQASVYGPSDGL